MKGSGFEFFDLKPAPADFRKEVIEGLTKSSKSISPKFFYDDEGSRLFDAITKTPEYYVTSAEDEILRTHGNEIGEMIGKGTYLVEYGSGNSTKTVTLINSLHSPASYVMIDISAESVKGSAERLSSIFPGLRIICVCADYFSFMGIPELADYSKKVIVFLGSTIGNLEPDMAEKFISSRVEDMKEGDGMLIGVDLKKDTDVLNSAYNDSAGYTARFNLNLIERIRRELDVDISPSKFQHRAFYNEDKGRIEMHLMSKEEQEFLIGGSRVSFQEGETIHTENSYKYSVDEFAVLSGRSGIRVKKFWTDHRKYFGLFYLEK